MGSNPSEAGTARSNHKNFAEWRNRKKNAEILGAYGRRHGISRLSKQSKVDWKPYGKTYEPKTAGTWTRHGFRPRWCDNVLKPKTKHSLTFRVTPPNVFFLQNGF